VETLHILGFALLLGSIAMFDLRVLGLGQALRLHDLGRHVLPWSVAGGGLAAATGALLFITHPQDYAANTVFFVKLGLIACAGLNAIAFHWWPWRQARHWPQGLAPAAAKAQALLSLLLWIAVIVAGRMLAYL
ncbi:MAG TPA: hypothetical protein VIT92_05180, partial [Burkholderiaceae bacterium]